MDTCTWTHAHGHMHMDTCTWAHAHGHMHMDRCVPTRTRRGRWRGGRGHSWSRYSPLTHVHLTTCACTCRSHTCTSHTYTCICTCLTHVNITHVHAHVDLTHVHARVHLVEQVLSSRALVEYSTALFRGYATLDAARRNAQPTVDPATHAEFACEVAVRTGELTCRWS